MFWKRTQKKNIWKYDRGGKIGWADPLQIYIQIAELLDGDPEGWVSRLESLDLKTSIEASKKIIPTLYKIFNLIPFDTNTGKGAPWEHALLVLREWAEWINKKKVNIEF